jgi:hypothetical protein
LAIGRRLAEGISAEESLDAVEGARARSDTEGARATVPVDHEERHGPEAGLHDVPAILSPTWVTGHLRRFSTSCFAPTTQDARTRRSRIVDGVVADTSVVRTNRWEEIMKRARVRLFLTFSVTAILAFGLALPTSAFSQNTRTLDGTACSRSAAAGGGYAYYCGMPVGTDFTTGSIAKAYADYYVQGGHTYVPQMCISKTSFTGTISQDCTTGSGARGTYDTTIIANHIKDNSSQYDYLSFWINSVDTFYGFAIQSN